MAQSVTQHLSRWAPSPGVTDHAGDAIPNDVVFFAPPPPEIGRILTAYSGLRGEKFAAQGPTTQKVFLIFVPIGLAIGAFLGAAFANGNPLGAVVGALLGGALAAFVVWRRERQKNTCTYTGEKGIARFFAGHEKGEVILFENVTHLQVAYLGRSNGTNFNFRWQDAKRRVLYKLEGGYYSDGTPHKDSPYHYARAAENAWSRYVFPLVQAEIARTGSCRFSISGISEQYLVIGSGYLDIFQNGKTHRLTSQDFGAITMNAGLITVQKKGAVPNAMGRGDGVYLLSYGAISNVQVFFLLLKQLVGVQIQ